MRNIPWAFIPETDGKPLAAARTEQPLDPGAGLAHRIWRRAVKTLNVALECDGPTSIANLERMMGPHPPLGERR